MAYFGDGPLGIICVCVDEQGNDCTDDKPGRPVVRVLQRGGAAERFGFKVGAKIMAVAGQAVRAMAKTKFDAMMVAAQRPLRVVALNPARDDAAVAAAAAKNELLEFKFEAGGLGIELASTPEGLLAVKAITEGTQASELGVPVDAAVFSINNEELMPGTSIETLHQFLALLPRPITMAFTQPEYRWYGDKRFEAQPAQFQLDANEPLGIDVVLTDGGLLVVAEVVPGGQCDQCGMRQHAVVLAVNTHRFRSYTTIEQFQKLLAQGRIDEVSGEKSTTNVLTLRVPALEQGVAKARKVAKSSTLGKIEVTHVISDGPIGAEVMAWPDGTLTVEAVSPGTQAEALGIKVGSVMRALNGQPCSEGMSVVDFGNAIQGLQRPFQLTVLEPEGVDVQYVMVPEGPLGAGLEAADDGTVRVHASTGRAAELGILVGSTVLSVGGNPVPLHSTIEAVVQLIQSCEKPYKLGLQPPLRLEVADEDDVAL